MDDRQDSRQRSRGPAIPLKTVIDIGQNISRVGRVATLLGTNYWIVFVILGIAIFTFTLTLLTGGEAAGIPTETAKPGSESSKNESNPITISGTGESCVAPYLGHGPCSINSLLPYFDGDRSKAIIASLICQSESSSNPFALNDTCNTGDYSVGLFQINAIYNCAGAYTPIPSTPSLSCSSKVDLEKRTTCENSWLNTNANINMAKAMSSNGARWIYIWSTWLYPGVTRIGIGDLLSQCGITN